MWWTITGNFGNILPIDWSKSYARKVQLPVLSLNNNLQVKKKICDSSNFYRLKKKLEIRLSRKFTHYKKRKRMYKFSPGNTYR